MYALVQRDSWHLKSRLASIFCFLADFACNSCSAASLSFRNISNRSLPFKCVSPICHLWVACGIPPNTAILWSSQNAKKSNRSHSSSFLTVVCKTQRLTHSINHTIQVAITPISLPPPHSTWCNMFTMFAIAFPDRVQGAVQRTIWANAYLEAVHLD